MSSVYITISPLGCVNIVTFAPIYRITGAMRQMTNELPFWFDHARPSLEAKPI
jgi:hypothetical protein